MKRNSFLLVLGCAILIVLAGCGARNEEAREHAQLVADAFSDGDVKTINEIVLGTRGLEFDDELADMREDVEQPQGGVLASIFKLVTVRVGDVTDSTIEYEVEAPDMSGVFEGLDKTNQEMTEDELLEYMKEYARSAQMRKITVSLEYALEGDKPVVNYREERFVNAVTGGLLDAYKALYSEMMSEYSKELSQQ